MMNLLQLIQQTCNELGITAPTAVVSSQDPQIKQLYALMNRHGHDLSRQYDWEMLNKEFILNTLAFNVEATITQNSAVVVVPSTSGITTNFSVTGNGIQPFASVASVDSGTQFTMNMVALQSGVQTLTMAQTAYPLPSDWLKQVPQTEWDRTNRWPMLGPKSPQEWQSYKSGIVYAGPRERFRIQLGALQISPPPPTGLTFAYEYISSAFVAGADGTQKSSFTDDTDTCIFDDSLMIVGLKMRWKSAKGLDWSAEGQEFNLLLSQIKAQDKSSPRLSLSPVAGSVYLGYDNVPDGSWASI